MANLSPVEIRDSILTLIRDNYSRTPVAWPNRKFNPDTEAIGGHWIRPNILMAGTEEGEVGLAGLSFRSGILKIQVFGPKNKEGRAAWVNAGSIEAIFRRGVDSCIIYGEPSTNEVGTDERYYQLAVDISFQALTE
jgi:hypothetical protein